MEYRRLGNSGLIVSALALGTMQFGKGMNMGGLGQDDTTAMIRFAVERGINFIDTADVYSGGESETLIGNALKFRREGVAQRVTVSAEPSDTALSDVAQMWHFTVRDNGIGIAAEYFERIFVIFQRLHTRESFSGSGIGLAICQRLIERHGGTIWLESVPGEGTAFHFTLQAVSTDQQGSLAVSPAGSSAGSSAGKGGQA